MRVPRLPSVAALGAAWVASFVFTFATIEFLNDHFGRISPARQIARYGELPFRDYFDPGYFLTEISSAAMQVTFGDNLLGEALLNSAFIATGAVLVVLLARRVTGSFMMGAVAGALVVLSLPRAYDYDKVLFFPLGLWLCWRYIDRRRLADVAILAAAIVAGALFRYDSAAYMGVAATTGIAVAHGRDWRGAARTFGWLAAVIVAFAMPALIFLERHGGITNAVDQMVTYGIREAEPLRLFTVPRTGDRILVRWAESVDVSLRRQFADDLGLSQELAYGNPAERTWEYTITDPSVERIKALVTHASVEDTSRIDRSRFTLIGPLDWRARVWQRLQIRFRPDLFDSRDAALLFGLFWLVPVAAFLRLLRRRRSYGLHEAAMVASLVASCIVLNLFILRPPVGARAGAITGPVGVLGTWLMVAAFRRGLAWRLLAVVILVGGLGGIAEVGEWTRRIRLTALSPNGIQRTVAELAEARSPARALPHIGLMADYVRRCTAPADRLFATWFAPDLYFFAQRPFAGQVVALFRAHWSDARFVHRITDALAAQSVPIVLIELATYETFRLDYPSVDDYLNRWYRHAGDASFDGDDSASRYRVLVRADRVPAAADQVTGFPCFRPPEEALTGSAQLSRKPLVIG